MFSKIVVLLDDSPGSAVALRSARTLSRLTGAVLLVVRAVAAADPGAEEAARAELTRFVDELKASGVAAVGVVKPDGGRAVVELSRQRGVRLVVMAAAEPGTRADDPIGPVAAYVLRGSRAPVLLLRPAGGRRPRLRALMVPWAGPGQAFVPLDAVAVGASPDTRRSRPATRPAT